MTVASTDAKAGPYTGNNIATTFAFAFKVFADVDIRVVETLISTGVETDLVLNGANGYTVTKNNDQDANPGGFITYKQANATAPLPSTKKLTIVGDFEFEQPTDLPNGGPFFARVVENALDRVTLLVKQQQEALNRAVKVDVSSTDDPNDLLDAVLAQTGADAAAAAASAASAAASYDSFDDRYLGAKASDPALDNDGNALLEGAIYWNTVTKALKAYNGTAWGPFTSVAYTVATFSGTGAQTAFTLPVAPVSKNNLFIDISGITQHKSTFSVAGTTLTFNAAPAAGVDNIEVVIAEVLSIGSATSNNVTHLGDALNSILKDHSFFTVSTLAEFKAVDKNKYTRVSRLGTGALGDGGRSEYWQDTADLVSAGDDWNIVVADDGARWKRLRLIWQTTTGGADSPTWQIARNTTHSGGTPGTVVNALNVSATIGSGVTNFEWGFLSQLDNSAAAGENVAIYGQAIKRADGPTWAGCFEIQDKNTDDPAQGGALGIELACSANGGDTSFQRIGLHVAMGKNNPGGTTCEWGTGVYTGAGADSRYARAFYNDGPVRLAAFFNAADSSNGALAGNATFLDTGKSTYGIDLSAATYTGVAMRLAAGQGIAFDTTGSPARIRKSGSNLAFENVPAVFSGGRVQMNNGFGLPASGNTAATATAGSSGATPAQVAGYLIFQLDGSNFKIPYYGP